MPYTQIYDLYLSLAIMMKMIVVFQLIAILLIARAPQVEATYDANGNYCNDETTKYNVEAPGRCCAGYKFDARATWYTVVYGRCVKEIEKLENVNGK